MEQLNGMSLHEKQAFLNDNASKIDEDVIYQRQLTPEEVVTAKEEFAEKSVVFEQKADNFNEVKKEMKAELDILKHELKAKITLVKTGHEMLKGNLYYLDDQEAGEMYIYDGAGNLIEQRRLRPNEKQKTIFSVNKQANS